MRNWRSRNWQLMLLTALMCGGSLRAAADEQEAENQFRGVFVDTKNQPANVDARYVTTGWNPSQSAVVRAFVKQLHEQLGKPAPDDKALDAAVKAFLELQQQQQNLERNTAVARFWNVDELTGLPEKNNPAVNERFARVYGELKGIRGITNTDMLVWSLTRPPAVLPGLQVGGVGPVMRAQFEIRDDEGLLVMSVDAKSPAARMGLEVNDILLAIDGKRVNNEDELKKALAAVGNKDVVARVIRQGDRKDLKFNRKKLFGESAGRKQYWIGVHIDELDDITRDHLQLDEGVGLAVTKVVPESPAASAGLRENDVLVTADGMALSNNEQLTKAVQKRGGGELSLELLRVRDQLALRVKPAVREPEPTETSGQTHGEADYREDRRNLNRFIDLGYRDQPQQKILWHTPVLLDDRAPGQKPPRFTPAVQIQNQQLAEQIRELTKAVEALKKQLERNQRNK